MILLKNTFMFQYITYYSMYLVKYMVLKVRYSEIKIPIKGKILIQNINTIWTNSNVIFCDHAFLKPNNMYVHLDIFHVNLADPHGRKHISDSFCSSLSVTKRRCIRKHTFYENYSFTYICMFLIMRSSSTIWTGKGNVST